MATHTQHCPQIGSPATAKNILAVGATQNTHLQVQRGGSLKWSVEIAGASYTGVPTPAVSTTSTAHWNSTYNGTVVHATPADGCQALTGSGYAGKIVLVREERGTYGTGCHSHTQIANVMAANPKAVSCKRESERERERERERRRRR